MIRCDPRALELASLALDGDFTPWREPSAKPSSPRAWRRAGTTTASRRPFRSPFCACEEAYSCHRTVGQVGAGGSDILSDRTGSVGERAAKHEACDVRILS